MSEGLKTILRDIASPVISFRLHAIETAVREEPSPELLSVLQAHEKIETNEECRQLLTQAIELCRARIAPEPNRPRIEAPTPMPGEAAASFRERFLSAPTAQRLECLLRLPVAERSRQAALAPVLLERETQPAVAIMLLRTFGIHWPRERLGDLYPRLSSPWVSLRLAALEVLTQRDPEQLREALPRLLVSEDPRTQALAIRGLAKIDLEEAIEHLRYLLEDADPALRRVALQNCFYLPFDQIRPLLYQFLLRERLPELVTDAGLLFAINPCPEVPFHLWEAFDQAPADRRPGLHLILERSIQALEKSKQLKVDVPFFWQRLESWGRRRRIEVLLQQWLSRASSTGEAAGDELEAALRARASDPDGRQVFEQALGWPISQDLRDRIKSWLPEARPTLTDPATFRNLPERDQIRLLLTPEAADPATPAGGPSRNTLSGLIDPLLRDAKVAPTVRAAALRRAMEGGQGMYVQLAHQWLSQQHPHLISSALEYLGRFDPEKVASVLGRFLKNAEPRIRTICIRLLRDLDPEQAISLLRSLLRSPDQRQQMLAMSWMVFFDFSRIRPLLAEFLGTCSDPNLFRNGLCLFLTNPDPENLYFLHRLDQPALSDRHEVVEMVRKQLTATLISQGAVTVPKLAALQQGYGKRAKEDAARAGAPAKPYAASTLRPSGPRSRFAEGLSGLPEWTEKPLFRLGLALTLGSILYLGSWIPTILEPAPTTSVFAGGSPGAVSTRPQTLTGIVVSPPEPTNGLVLQTDAGERYLVIPKGGGTLAGKPGERRQLTVVPFRRNSRGIILCQEP